jgi:hypothetical protein
MVLLQPMDAMKFGGKAFTTMTMNRSELVYCSVLWVVVVVERRVDLLCERPRTAWFYHINLSLRRLKRHTFDDHIHHHHRKHTERTISS